MLPIILFGLIANLAVVLGDCDLGPSDMNDFSLDKLAGPGYVLLHTPNTFDNNLDCVVVTTGPKQGNIYLVTIEAFVLSTQDQTTIYGYASKSNRQGYYTVKHSVQNLNGRYHVVQADYKRYAIVKVCPFNTETTELYVAFRSSNPDQDTVNEVIEELQEINIYYNQLVNRTANHCNAQSSSEEGSSEGSSDGSSEGSS